MHELPLSCVPNWNPVVSRWCPVSVDPLCPSCDKRVNFTLANHYFDQPRVTISATGQCPACGDKAQFWVVKPELTNTSQRGCDGLFIFPKPRPLRQPVIAKDELDVPALERAYHSAVNAHNAGLWAACATSCRKTLEGIVKTQLPDAKPPFFNQLKEVFSRQELLDPLIHLTDMLRKGGNLGAHFDLEKEPNEEVATLMLDLLDFIMDYIFRLKYRSQHLETRLDSLGGENGG